MTPDGTARLWDAKTGQERTVLRGHASWVFAVKFAPDGQTVKVDFDPATGSNPSVLDGVEGDTRQIRSPASCALK